MEVERRENLQRYSNPQYELMAPTCMKTENMHKLPH